MIMKPRVGSTLVLLALVSTVVCKITSFEPPELELPLDNALLGGLDHDFSSFSSSRGLQAAITTKGELFSDRMGRGSHQYQRFGPKDDAGMIASAQGSFLREAYLKNSALTFTASKNSRALLQQSSNPSCPVDFQFISEFPSIDYFCQDSDPSNSSSQCCTVLLSVIGQAESEYLRNTGEFRFKDVATVSACITSLSSAVYSGDNSLNKNLVSTCFPASNYSRFVRKPSNCQGIETRADFERLVGVEMINSTLNQYCSSSSLLDQQLCGECVTAMESVYEKLSFLGPNNSDCLYYTLFYAAGISNLGGPLELSTASCILAVVPYTPKKGNSKSLALHIGIGAASAFVACVIVFIVFFLWWKRKRGAARREFIERNTRLLQPAMRPNTGLIEYSFEEIKAATKSFSSKNYIGSGGFGEVYHGLLDDGLEVAVKRMKNCSSDGDADFLNEVNVINSVRHRNLVILRGCCVASTEADGHQRLLVYDYISNGSLQDYLFGKKNRKPLLEWPDRRQIAMGMAKGIAYLHNDARPPIIHRDIKASNVLLDEKLKPKVADFGLAKFSIEGLSHVETAVAGTLGYVAPEYALYGQLTDKSDVYSFGVVLLELMSGRSAIEGVLGEYALITDWAWGKVNQGKSMEVVDSRIRNTGPGDVMVRFVLVGILCSHMLVAFRPTMEEVLKYLEGDVPVPRIPNRPLPINMEFTKGDNALVLPSPTEPPPRSSLPINVADAVAALSVEDQSEEAKLYREQMAAMSEYSGVSAGVPTASLLR
ncbi:unnamed protein product [Calypogeia fissa]